MTAKTRTRLSVAVLVLCTCALLFGIWVLVMTGLSAVRTHAKHVAVQSELSQIAVASRAYCDEHLVWPQTLSELTNNPAKHSFFEVGPEGFVDPWGYPYEYRPYSTNRMRGSVISRGADGKPGGTGEDADHTIDFGGTR